MYFIALLLYIFLLKETISPLTFTGIFESSKPYWFVPSIIICYISAPFLYNFLKDCDSKKFLISLSTIFIAMNIPIILFHSNDISNANLAFWLFYRGLLFSYLFLFSVGLPIPRIIETNKSKLKPEWIKQMFVYSIIAMIVCTFIARNIFFKKVPLKNQFILRNLSHINPILAILFFISLIFFVLLVLLQYKGENMFLKAISFIGINSYGIYLFEPIISKYFAQIGLLVNGNNYYIAMILVIFPIAILVTMILEKPLDYLRKKIK